MYEQTYRDSCENVENTLILLVQPEDMASGEGIFHKGNPIEVRLAAFDVFLPS
jgi:hypothetical protein